MGERLAALDPDAAARMEPGNRRRIDGPVLEQEFGRPEAAQRYGHTGFVCRDRLNARVLADTGHGSKQAKQNEKQRSATPHA